MSKEEEDEATSLLLKLGTTPHLRSYQQQGRNLIDDEPLNKSDDHEGVEEGEVADSPHSNISIRRFFAENRALVCAVGLALALFVGAAFCATGSGRKAISASEITNDEVILGYWYEDDLYLCNNVCGMEDSCYDCCDGLDNIGDCHCDDTCGSTRIICKDAEGNVMCQSACTSTGQICAAKASKDKFVEVPYDDRCQLCLNTDGTDTNGCGGGELFNVGPYSGKCAPDCNSLVCGMEDSCYDCCDGLDNIGDCFCDDTCDSTIILCEVAGGGMCQSACASEGQTCGAKKVNSVPYDDRCELCLVNSDNNKKNGCIDDSGGNEQFTFSSKCSSTPGY